MPISQLPLLVALLASDPAAGGSNAVSPAMVATNSPVEVEFRELLARDDAAQSAVLAWIREEQEADRDPVNAPFRETLRVRMDRKFQPIRDAYVDFLLRHPDHARAHLAFGSFLNDLGEDNEALEHFERARDLDPKNPAVWNNLGGLYARLDQVPKALTCYAEAIRLNPTCAAYHHRLGTVICLFRSEAARHYHCDESSALQKGIQLYREAARLDPQDFEIAQDLAETYYGLLPGSSPLKDDQKVTARQALVAWTNALQVAGEEIQREGVYLHLARWQFRLGEATAARESLGQVTDRSLEVLKNSIAKGDWVPSRLPDTNASPKLDALPARSDSNAVPSAPALRSSSR